MADFRQGSSAQLICSMDRSAGIVALNEVEYKD